MNAPLSERIVSLTDKDLHQGFDDQNPYFYLQIPGKNWGDKVTVDSFPCYTHDTALVAKIAEHVEKIFPVNIKPYWFIIDREDLSRTNGYATKAYVYKNDDERVVRPYIVLKGKRIPIHPAMTRYLTAHEYGHVVDYFISKKKNPDNDDSEPFRKEYAKRRGIEYSTKYGARGWHLNTGEVIANDFRIAVAGVEREFWPHPYPHPDEDTRVGNLWYELMLEFGYESK